MFHLGAHCLNLKSLHKERANCTGGVLGREENKDKCGKNKENGGWRQFEDKEEYQNNSVSLPNDGVYKYSISQSFINFIETTVNKIRSLKLSVDFIFI